MNCSKSNALLLMQQQRQQQQLKQQLRQMLKMGYFPLRRLLLAAGALYGLQFIHPRVASADPHKAPNPALWGYSGLFNVPTAEVMPNGTYIASLRYFPLNTGLSGSATVSLFDNLEAGLVFGIPPANGFASMAGSLKYRLINQAQGLPVSLAVGATLLGANNTSSYVPSNSLFLTLSHELYLPYEKQIHHLANFHAGFMGGLNGARLVGGLEIPIMDYGRIKMEYLGSLNDFSSQAFNLGLNFTPLPFLHIDMALMQLPGRTFWDRDFILGVGYSGNFGFAPASPSPSPRPTTEPTITPSATPVATPTPGSQIEVQSTATALGSFRIRVVDRQSQTALAGAEIRLSSPDLKLQLDALTDIIGESAYIKVPTGAYEAEVVKEGWYSESRFISIQENRETFIEIALSQRLGRISGRVVFADGNPVTDQGSQLDLTDSRGALIKQVVPEANGSYFFTEVLPGKYTLTLLYKGKIITRKSIEIAPAGVIAQEFTVDIPESTSIPTPAPTPVPTPTVPATPPPQPSAAPSSQEVSAQIEGQVKDDKGQVLGGIRLKLENDDLMVITLSSNEGKYSFREIPKGTYRLSLSKTGFKTRVFQITILRSESLTHNFEMSKE
jgi:hypothetical protein